MSQAKDSHNSTWSFAEYYAELKSEKRQTTARILTIAAGSPDYRAMMEHMDAIFHEMLHDAKSSLLKGTRPIRIAKFFGMNLADNSNYQE